MTTPRTGAAYLRVVAATVAVLLGMAPVALRAVDPSHPLLFALAATAPIYAAVGWVMGVLIMPDHRTRLPVVVVGLMVLAAIVPPSMTRLGCDDQRASGAVTVYAHNVHFRYGSPQLVADQLLTIQPDIAILQESDAAFVEAVQAALAVDGAEYDHVVGAPTGNALGLAILSRWPLTDVVDTSPRAAVVNPSLIVTVVTDRGSFRLAGIHLSAPINAALIDRWRTEYDELVDLDVDIVAGDFNSTLAHRRFRELVADGYVGAHDEVGCGLGLTWSPSPGGIRLMRIDHVLIAEDGPVVPLSARTLDGSGSDHRALLVEVGFRP